NQLSSVGLLESVRLENDRLYLSGLKNEGFLTGGWLELVVADAVTSHCPFNEFALLKNFRFRVKSSEAEVDLLLLTPSGSFLFETKTYLKSEGLESSAFRLYKTARLLSTPATRAYLVVPSAEDAEVSELPYGLKLASLSELGPLLRRAFYEASSSIS
ncbi:MAG: NERD domain-containing protein, partial [Aquificae bacterium]|nr:NERD domain-containing protein [Aquificota bacterium]